MTEKARPDNAWKREPMSMPEKRVVFSLEQATELASLARQYADQLETCMEILLGAPANAVDSPGGPGLNIPPGPYRIVLATKPQHQEGNEPGAGDEPGICGLCHQPMPSGEEMFRYHGFSGPCPAPASGDAGS